VVYGSIAAHICKINEMYALIAGLGSIIRGSGFKNSIVRAVLKCEYKLAFKYCKAVITHNSEDRQLLIDEKFTKEPEKVKTVNGSGVNLNTFRYSETKKNNIFLFIARLIGDKGIREYMEAAEIVKKTHPEATFRVVGPYDTNPSALKPEEIERYVKNGTIEYVGELKDVTPQLNECMVFVLPSYHEGTPKTVLEAMATGRAVITTDVPGCRATVQNGENGYLVSAKNADALAERMIYMLEHFDKVQELAKKGRKIAEDKYDSVKVNRSILDIMEIPYKEEVSA
ncbi:MAG: glycosyltransferase family 4 protein, partial [Clostridia bacterium]|nr:glycosyltransferase family 4 protein [Clostridia bacterium]